MIEGIALARSSVYVKEVHSSIQVSRCHVGWKYTQFNRSRGRGHLSLLVRFRLKKDFLMVNYDLPPAACRFFSRKLYQTMSEDLQIAGMSECTVHGYLWAVRQLADYCQTSPDKITQQQFRRYLLYLKNEMLFAHGTKALATSSQRQR
jgi:hypothetical protein